MAFRITCSFKLFLLLIFFSQISLAQLCFDANITRTCAPDTISIIECVGSNVDKSSLRYNYDWQTGQGPGGTTDTFHIYTDPGLYSILQTGNVDGSGDTLLRFEYIEILPSPLPEFYTYLCDDNGIVVEITDLVYEKYIFDWGDGSPLETLDVSISTRIYHQYATPGQQNFRIIGRYDPGGCGQETTGSITTINSIPTPLITNFKTNLSPYSIEFSYSSIDRVSYVVMQSQDGGQTFVDIDSGIVGDGFNDFVKTNPGDTVSNQCFKVEARDACGNIISSETICGIELQGEAQNNRNELVWSAYKGPNLDSFEVIRDGVRIAYATASFPPSPFYDSLVICGEEYTYEIRALINSGAYTSSSNFLEIKSFSTDTPDAVTTPLVTTNLDNTVISWDSGFNVVEYSVLRELNGQIGLNGKTTETEFPTDVQDKINLRTCYTILYLDSCGNTSPITVFQCPVILEVRPAPNLGHTLNWTDYTGWPEGVAYYEVQKTNLDGQVFFREPLDSSTFTWTESGIDTSFQDFYYRIAAVQASGDSLISISNWELVEQEFRIFYPTAFTPNADGLNDVFVGKGRFIKEYKMVVMNQWGEVIFESRDIDIGWDGTYKGNESPVGTYIYQVEAIDEKGHNFEEKGTITLLR